MSLSPGKKIKVNDINYYVYDEGDGDKVALLVHGWPEMVTERLCLTS